MRSKVVSKYMDKISQEIKDRVDKFADELVRKSTEYKQAILESDNFMKAILSEDFEIELLIKVIESIQYESGGL